MSSWQRPLWYTRFRNRVALLRFKMFGTRVGYLRGKPVRYDVAEAYRMGRDDARQEQLRDLLGRYEQAASLLRYMKGQAGQ